MSWRATMLMLPLLLHHYYHYRYHYQEGCLQWRQYGTTVTLCCRLGVGQHLLLRRSRMYRLGPVHGWHSRLRRILCCRFPVSCPQHPYLAVLLLLLSWFLLIYHGTKDEPDTSFGLSNKFYFNRYRTRVRHETNSRSTMCKYSIVEHRYSNIFRHAITWCQRSWSTHLVAVSEDLKTHVIQQALALRIIFFLLFWRKEKIEKTASLLRFYYILHIGLYETYYLILE